MNTTMVEDKDARILELEGMLQESKHMGYEGYILPFGLTQQQARLLALLMDVPVATADIIKKNVKMSTEDKVAIHRLRKRLEKFGIVISAKRYYGFWLDADEKAKVNRVLWR